MTNAGFGGQVRLEGTTFEYVYVLKCNNDKTYVGHTSNLEDRLTRHNNGYVPATKNLRHLQLLSYLAFSDKYKAIAFEKCLKSGSGRAFMKKRLI